MTTATLHHKQPDFQENSGHNTAPADPPEVNRKFLRITDWIEKYETHDTRKLNYLHWVAVPIGMEGAGFRELLSHPDGLAHFGVWILLLELAGKQPKPRNGSIVRGDGKLPHDAESIAKLLGWSRSWGRSDVDVLELVMSRAREYSIKETISAAIERLLELGWLEAVEAPQPFPHEEFCLPHEVPHFCSPKPQKGLDSLQVVEKIIKSGDSPGNREMPGLNRTEQNLKTSSSSSEAEGVASTRPDDFALNGNAFEDVPVKPELSEIQQHWFDEEFWPGYWRKEDKAEAIKAFKKHATSVALKDKIIAAVKEQGAMYMDREVKLRPLGATWLNKRRYEDEIHASPARVVPSPYTIED
jgi:hypothetical protein